MYLFISAEIREWKRLARNLNIGDDTIDEIDDNPKDRCKDKCQNVFSDLKKRNTRVTWDLVREALQQIRRNDVITNFEKKYVNSDPT